MSTPTEIDVRAGLPSASGLGRLLGCPGSFELSRGMVSPEKAWTREGTKGHAMLSGEEGDEEASDDTQAQVARCEQYLGKLREDLGFEHGCIELGAPGGEPCSRFWLHDDSGAPVASGEPDRVLIRDNIALIVDFKLGRKAVEAPSLNPQLIGYALLLEEEYGITGAYLQIIQPWAKRQEPAYIDAEGLKTWRAAIMDAIRVARQPDAPRQAGPHCDYCPARPICPEARAVATRALAPMGGEAAPVIAQSFALMTAEQKLQLWDWAQHAKKTLKDLDDLYKAALATAPESIPGLRVKPGAKQLKIPGSPAVIAALEAAGLAQEAILGTASLSGPKLDKLLTGGRKTLLQKLGPLAENCGRRCGRSATRSRRRPGALNATDL